MKIAIINRSDLRGGAAVASFRLMEALRRCGHDARMLVVEKLSDSPFVEAFSPAWKAKVCFLRERLQIFLRNGLQRRNLFAVDTASVGLPLRGHPLLREADAILLGWTNQGMLSLRGTLEIARLGKPVVQTMHDMWCATGICHHAGTCRRFMADCRSCPLLGNAGRKEAADLSSAVQKRKQRLYAEAGIKFVAVSNWLADKCAASTVLGPQRPEVIPNPLPFEELSALKAEKPSDRIEAVMAAARLDEEVKGLDLLEKALDILERDAPEAFSRLHITFCGTVRRPQRLARLRVAHTHTGPVSSADLGRILSRAHLLLAPSRYESWGYTLAEAQACGALPVAFRRGGVPDIILPASAAGVLAPADASSDAELAASYADALQRALQILATEPEEELLRRLRASAARFSAEAVAAAYLRLLSPPDAVCCCT